MYSVGRVFVTSSIKKRRLMIGGKDELYYLFHTCFCSFDISQRNSLSEAIIVYQPQTFACRGKLSHI